MSEISILGIDVQYSRPPPLHIPTEVCENIIDMLYSDFPGAATLWNISALHNCALVCRDWRVRAQRMLFYRIQLSDAKSLHRLSTALDGGQHLRDYEYQIELTGYLLHNTTSIFTLLPAVFGGKLPKLEVIRVVHLTDDQERQFPRRLGPPKAKALPYIPLHSHFPALLSSFTAVSTLYLENTTFRSFSELARLIRGLPSLESLACCSVCWIAPGGSHPGADFMQPPDWTTMGPSLPLFAPMVRSLEVRVIAVVLPFLHRVHRVFSSTT